VLELKDWRVSQLTSRVLESPFHSDLTASKSRNFSYRYTDGEVGSGSIVASSHRRRDRMGGFCVEWKMRVVRVLAVVSRDDSGAGRFDRNSGHR
jgi:hypothetical protein